MPTLPSYRGVYGRVFLPPTMLIGLGRFGSAVCGDFLRQLEQTLKPNLRGHLPEGSPSSLIASIAKVAVVRDMDKHGSELAWADQVFAWPADVEGELHQIHQDVITDRQQQQFWDKPRQLFDARADGLLYGLGPHLAHRMGSVSNDGWSLARDAMGLPPIGSLGVARCWVFAVGSLWEPDVAALVPRLRKFSVDQVVLGDAGRVVNIFLLDCGQPDHPDFVNSTWKHCPASLTDQLFSTMKQAETAEGSISFFTSSTRLSRIEAPVSVRKRAAAGVMKSYLLSTVLEPRDESAPIAELLVQPSSELAAARDRAASFVEIALDLGNLSALIAAEVMAEWKRRLSRAQQVGSLADISGDLSTFLRAPLKDAVLKLLVPCCRSTILEGSSFALESFRSRVADERDHVVERCKILRDREQKGDQPAPPKRHGWIGRLFGMTTAAPVDQPPRESLSSLSQNLDGINQLLSALDAIVTIARELNREDSSFHDRTHDHHFEKSMDSSTCIIRYRRIPLGSCPVFIGEFIDETVALVDGMLVEIISGGVPAASLLSMLDDRIRKKWNDGPGRTQEAEAQWGALGIVQWMRTDECLVKGMADFAYERLVPLWRAMPGREGNWRGRLSVFEFGARLQNNERDLAIDAVKRLSKSLQLIYRDTAAGSHFDRSWHFNAALKTGDFHFEAWPFFYSVGLLWTDYPTEGRGFADDWDTTQLGSRASAWRAGNFVEPVCMQKSETESGEIECY